MFVCMECGHKFRTVKAAERASFGPEGCPGCGGSDIDIDAVADRPRPDNATAQVTRIREAWDAVDRLRI